MSVQDTVKKWVEAFDRHDAAAAAAAYASGVVVHDPQYPEPLRGRDAIRRDAEDFFKAFPDLRMTLKTVVESGDTFAWEISMSGTHSGPLVSPGGEVPATNRRMEMGVAGFSRLDGQGLIVEERRYYDLAGMMAQLGLMPGS